MTKKHKQKAQRGILLCLLLCAAPVAAQAQQRDMQSQINRLENDLETLSRAVFKGEQPALETTTASAKSQYAGMEVRLNQIETEMRALNGRLEEQAHQNEQLNKTIEDLQARIATLESGQSAAQSNIVEPIADNSLPMNDPMMTGSAPPQPVGSINGQTPPENFGAAPAPEAAAGALQSGGDAPTLYESAYAQMKAKKYPEAERLFTDFLDQYPQHDLAANAKYWLGETFYVRADYKQSARVFAEAYQKYPKGPKGADSLLKLALSLDGMGQRQDACIALAQLKKEYAAGISPVLTRADKEMATLGCAQ